MMAKVNALRECDPHRLALPMAGETPLLAGGLRSVLEA
jgi:hypothetical protein